MKYLVPVGIFFALAMVLFFGLSRDPSVVPTVMIDKPAPAFDLPPLKAGQPGFSSDDLKQGRVSVVNIFASWCVPCRVEHPQLEEIAKIEDVDLYAINYKDDPQDALTFLDRLGNPFKAVGADQNGRAAIEWGVYGVPETFVLNSEGRIIFRHVGPIMPEDIEHKFLPVIRKARP